MTQELTEHQQRSVDYICDLYIRSTEDAQKRMLYGIKEISRSNHPDKSTIGACVIEQLKIKS